MDSEADANRTAISDLRARLAALSVPHQTATQGRGSNVPRHITENNAGPQVSESSCGRGRGRPRVTEQRAPPVNPNYKMALQPTSLLLQQLSVHCQGRMNVACPDCDALHWEAEKLVQTSRVNPNPFTLSYSFLMANWAGTCQESPISWSHD
jgi:hypothetical protein